MQQDEKVSFVSSTGRMRTGSREVVRICTVCHPSYEKTFKPKSLQTKKPTVEVDIWCSLETVRSEKSVSCKREFVGFEYPKARPDTGFALGANRAGQGNAA
ncbi:MAG: hypothetical protein ACK5YQ_09275 [Betaproteobacteria bacterium]